VRKLPFVILRSFDSCSDQFIEFTKVAYGFIVII
jgi:hypothetical protein